MSDPAGALHDGSQPIGSPSGAPMWTPEQLATLPNDNLGPQLNAVNWTLNSLAALFIALRIYCKVSRGNRLWWDDFVLLASWVCVVVSSVTLSVCVSYGYGHHVWDFPFENFPKFVPVILVSGTLLVVSAIWSKTSFAITLLRFTDGKLKILVWFIIVSMNIGMGLTALMAWVQCNPIRRVWDPTIQGTCWGSNVLVNFDIFSAAYSGAMDIVLALLPWPLLWPLRMKKREKFGVVIAMSMGIIAGILSIVKTTKLPLLLSSDMYDTVSIPLWGNIETNFSIIAASIPFLRVLVRDASSAAQRYYDASGDGNSHSRNPSEIKATRTNRDRDISLVETRRGKRLGNEEGNGPHNSSDQSIFNDKISHGSEHITRSSEVIVDTKPPV